MLLRLRHRASAWAALAALAAASGCPDGGDDTDAGRDAGRDAAQDAGRDGGRDAGRDGGRDAGRDGGSDGGPDDPAGWAPLPGLPDGCAIERAEHPEVLFTPEWESCGEGCEVVVHDPRWLRSFSPNVGAHDGGRGYFSVVQGQSLELERIVVLGATEGSPVAAWRGPSPLAEGVCSVGPLALSASGRHVGFNVTVFGDAWPREDRIYHAPLDEIGHLTEPVAILDSSWLPGGNAVQHLAVSAAAVAAEVQLAGYIALVEDGVLGRLIDADSAVRGTPQRLQMVGSTVYWTDYADKARIARGSLSEPESHYLEVDGADVVGGQVDGEWVAWQQATPVGGPYTAAELWAAPYSEDPAALAPTPIAELAGFAEYRMAAGIYAVLRGATATEPGDHIELYDLDDGRRRVFRPPGAHRLRAAPLYVTSEEMLVATRVDGRPSLLRVQLASLPYEE